jgi:hypothetical protein
MPYFDPASDKPERIGKVVGDLFVATIMLTFIVIFGINLLGR